MSEKEILSILTANIDTVFRNITPYTLVEKIHVLE